MIASNENLSCEMVIFACREGAHLSSFSWSKGNLLTELNRGLLIVTVGTLLGPLPDISMVVK